MKLRLYLVVVLWLVCYSYSYSETINGHTTNATATGLQWVMTDILPKYTGLTINTVNYSYTAVKETKDSMIVNVQNQNALGTGYIFRSTDDWTGLPGNTITKAVPVNSIPIDYWGNGEITVQGKGEVKNASVIYSYSYDTCSGTVVTDPRCPNYKPNIPALKLQDPLDDEFVKKSLDNKPPANDPDEEERQRKLVAKDQTATKKAAIVAKVVQNALLTAEAAANAAALESLNNIPNFSLYSKALPGGTYPETTKYVDKVLPDSKNAKRLNLSQEQLHNKLIESQYTKENK